MSPVHERMRELESEVRDLDVLPAAAVRARGRSRGRRRLAAVVVAGAVVATTAGVTFAWPDRQDNTTPAAVPPALNCVLALPASPADVRVRVVDGGASAGVADAAAAQLRARTFTVLDATTGPEGATALRYGPAAIGSAALLRAALHGEVTMQFDETRGDGTVDLVLGPAFTRLATTTELNQNLVTVGEPTAPPQC